MTLRKTAWTRGARATLDRARAWAERCGNGRVASRHLLVALAETPEPRAVRVCAEVASRARLAHALESLRGSIDGDGGTLQGIRDVPLTPSGRALLERAIDLGARTRGATVQSEHLWLALASTDDTELRRLLTLASSSVPRLHEVLRAPLPTPPAPPARQAGAASSERAAAASDASAHTEVAHHAPEQLAGAAGWRHAKLAGADLSDDGLVRAATRAFEAAGDAGVAEFVRALAPEARLRLARAWKRKTDAELAAAEEWVGETRPGDASVREGSREEGDDAPATELPPNADRAEESAGADPEPAPTAELAREAPGAAPRPWEAPRPARSLWTRLLDLLWPPRRDDAR